jgi:hypothetical protein
MCADVFGSNLDGCGSAVGLEGSTELVDGAGSEIVGSCVLDLTFAAKGCFASVFLTGKGCTAGSFFDDVSFFSGKFFFIGVVFFSGTALLVFRSESESDFMDDFLTLSGRGGRGLAVIEA